MCRYLPQSDSCVMYIMYVVKKLYFWFSITFDKQHVIVVSVE